LSPLAEQSTLPPKPPNCINFSLQWVEKLMQFG